MKTKVQAQRKFAQGAYIAPSSNINTGMDRKGEVTTGKDNCNVFHNNTPAKTLLDIVCFKNMHTHIQPIVLLERLRDKPTTASNETTSSANNDICNLGVSNIPPSSATNNDVPHNGRVNTVTPLIFRRKFTLVNRNTMCLRSRKRVVSGPSKESKKKVLKKMRTNKPRLVNKEGNVFKATSPLKPDDDDDRPLVFYRQKATITSPEKSHQKRRTAKRAICPKNVLKSGPNKDKCIKHHAQTGETNSERRAVNKLHVSKKTKLNMRGIVKKVQNRHPRIIVEQGILPQKVDPGTTRKGVEKKVQNRPSRKILEEENLLQNVENGPVQKDQFYSTNEIENWIENSINGKTVIDNVTEVSEADTFKIPELPKRKNSNRDQTIDIRTADSYVNDSQSVSESVISCVSKSFITVKDVIEADERELQNRCKNCIQCQIVTRLEDVVDLMKNQRRDVYEFDVDKDDSVNAQRRVSYISRKRRHTTSTDNLNNSENIDINKELKEKILNQQLCTVLEKHIENITRELRSIASHCNKRINKEIDSRSNPVDQSPQADFAVPGTSSQYTPHPVRADNKSSENASRSKKKSCVEESSKKNLEQRETPPKNTTDNQQYSNCKIKKAQELRAPVFYPTEQEFSDPVTYFEKIMPEAAKYGLCKIVAPRSFTPSCVLSESIRFTVTNQYTARLYKRWGPASRELSAIRALLSLQNVYFARPPLLEGLEVNLPKMFHIVQRLGGLKAVFDKKKWTKVAEEMNFPKLINPEKKLDQIYVKYLLPYDALTRKERQDLMYEVDEIWTDKYKKLMKRALNPLHRQKRLLGESDSSSEEGEDDEQIITYQTNVDKPTTTRQTTQQKKNKNKEVELQSKEVNRVSNKSKQREEVRAALAELEDCVVAGRVMTLSTFKKVAGHAFDMYFEPGTDPTTGDIEELYWRMVLLNNDHICINTASIDTGEEGYGFTKNKNEPYAKHPWNLKMLSQNHGNVLRSLGAALGVTVPTLHLGMVFSTSCWHRDPHGLPWIEYMHDGPAKIWYGIPDEQSRKFRKAVEILCPTSCQNKSIWLPSDITMIPPNLLKEHDVSLSRIEQRPGEFIIVFPKAYSCSISTGFTISESVYFATHSWLKNVHQVFQEVRNSCEPTMFSLEQLLLSGAKDPRAPLTVLQQTLDSLSTIVSEELANRAALRNFGLKSRVAERSRRHTSGSWNVRDEDECEVCRTTLYLSRVKGVFNKHSVWCLPHTLRVLDDPKQKSFDISAAVVEILIEAEELNEVIDNAQDRLVKVRL